MLRRQSDGVAGEIPGNLGGVGEEVAESGSRGRN